MYRRDQERKKSNPWIFVVVIALSLLSEIGSDIIGSILAVIIGLAAILAPVLIIFYVTVRRRKKPSADKREAAFDDCPKTICFHKDKGAHHVRSGREIDPWDRPDIDISKYQRRQ